MEASLQETHAPENQCFGCGPANLQGLRIRSFQEADGSLVCRWRPEPHHQAFGNILNGGIIGTLLDCHCNWAACVHFMAARKLARPPCTVTAEYSIRLRRPTPLDSELLLCARVIESEGSKAVVEGTLEVEGELTATCRGTFVAVEEGHPAFHRW